MLSWASRVLMIPYFLSAGVHLVRDLTAARDELAAAHPGVAFVLALIGYLILGIVTPVSGPGFDPSSAQAALAGEFWISPVNLLPLVLLLILSLRRASAFLSIYASALFAGVLGCFTQPQVVADFVAQADQSRITSCASGPVLLPRKERCAPSGVVNSTLPVFMPSSSRRNIDAMAGIFC